MHVSRRSQRLKGLRGRECLFAHEDALLEPVGGDASVAVRFDAQQEEKNTREDILDRLRVDPGQRTIGQLLQEREAAAHEIRALRAENERLRTVRTQRKERADTATKSSGVVTARAGMLIRISEVCEMVGMGRTTIYRWVNEGTFPSPVRVSKYAVRWRVDDVERWRDAL